MVRHNNQLPTNLPQLQNLLKRDPASYRDEFMQQYRHYKSTKLVFEMKPDQNNKGLDDLVMFLAQVAHCFPNDLVEYPQELMDILQRHPTTLNPDMRKTFCRALILLRNKNLISPTALLTLFFQLLRCPDKELRSFLKNHIITDIKNVNSKSKNVKLNNVLQNFMFGMLKDSNAIAAKMSLDVMIELYRKNIWNDHKTVNVISTACLSKVTKIMVTALQFFMGSDEKPEEESEDEDEAVVKREAGMALRVNKKSRKREKQMGKVTKMLKKRKQNKKAPVFNFSALHLVRDPQSFAEQLYRHVEGMNERFEVKVMGLDVISRLIGLHQLFVFNYYPYLIRFLQPHQRDVTKMLLFSAQASHELLPPDVIEPVVNAIVNNFVTERNSSEVMAVGLNSIREICVRCPLVMNADLLRDLVEHRTSKHKSVMMAARSILQLYRVMNPELLPRKERGRPTEAMSELHIKAYGALDARSYIPGAEALQENIDDIDDDQDDSSAADSDDGSWEDVSQSDDDGWVNVSHDNSQEDADEDASEDEGEGEDGWESVNGEEDESSDDDDGESSAVTGESSEKRNLSKWEKKKQKRMQSDLKSMRKKTVAEAEDVSVMEERKTKAAAVSLNRILTDKDFARIDAAQVKKQVQATKSQKKRNAGDDITESNNRSELVRLDDIEKIHKKRRHDKDTRLATVLEGRADREKPTMKPKRQNPFASTTNREKSKNKNFMMLKQKAKGKQRRSFKDKQLTLKNALLKRKKMALKKK